MKEILIDIRQLSLLLLCLILVVDLSAQQKSAPAFLTFQKEKWADNILKQMTDDEKIGQLLMPRGNNSGKPHDVDKLAQYVKDYKIGGIVFFAGQPTVQAKITNYLQSISKTPLFIGEDFEWGLAMRMDSTDRFPYNLMLGAVDDKNELIEKMGVEVGRQCKRLGVHINYAPVVDVNVNIDNPVINFRSFGENKKIVANHALAYMKGLQSQNILATAKHFPGHGDTNVDSHKDLPIIPHDRKRLDSVEFYPFQMLINNGIAGIMTSHLEVPSLESKSGLAATFSKSILTDVLRRDMGFKGLTFTDAMDMKGAIKNFPVGGHIVAALLAGNDVIETFEDVPLAVSSIKKALQDKIITMAFIEEKVKRILLAKAWAGLDNYQPIEIKNLINDLNTANADYINRVFAESAITLIQNNNDILPIRDITKKIAVVSVDAYKPTAFQLMCKNYTQVDTFLLNAGMSIERIDQALANLNGYDQVIVGLHLKEVRPSSGYSVTPFNQNIVAKLSVLPSATICIFGNVFALNKFESLSKFDAILAGYQSTVYSEETAAQMIFGALPTLGKIPVSLSSAWKQGIGIHTKALDRMSYGLPEQVGVDGIKLNHNIDSIVYAGLAAKAYPGAVVQVIKDGKSIFQKAYGFHTYEQVVSGFENNAKSFEEGLKTDAMDFFESKVAVEKMKSVPIPEGKVRLTDLYDFASITKISASALSLMRMQSLGNFDVNNTFTTYLPDVVKSGNKANLTFKDMLTHRAGLQAWIPFWRNAVDTSATVNLALKNNPLLADKFLYQIKKPSFFKRLFGAKAKKTLLLHKSLDSVKGLWLSCLTPQNRVWKANVFSISQDNNHIASASTSMFVNKSFQEQSTQAILNSPLKPDQGYVYSDLHYYLYPQLVQKITGQKMEDFVGDMYKKIGANSLGYLPLKRFSKKEIVPTEYDSLFRNVLIHGYVHDEGAAIFGGVSGHAGLFGNANDLSKLMLLYLQKGSFGGENILNSRVVEDYTSYQFPQDNRRGLAFDKPDPTGKVMNAPKLASAASFGHSGFTGTYTWVDPQVNMLYVFLSNRVYPTRDNGKISSMNIRTAIGDAVYKSLLK
jgi:beta-N-acetylhexosaminidase